MDTVFHEAEPLAVHTLDIDYAALKVDPPKAVCNQCMPQTRSGLFSRQRRPFRKMSLSPPCGSKSDAMVDNTCAGSQDKPFSPHMSSNVCACRHACVCACTALSTVIPGEMAACPKNDRELIVFLVIFPIQISLPSGIMVRPFRTVRDHTSQAVW